MADIVPTVKSDNISTVLDNIADNLDWVLLNEHGSIVSKSGPNLTGQVEGLAGILNSNAAYEVRCLESEQGLSSSGDWGYYAKPLAAAPSQCFKVWVRWNVEEGTYDYYLRADAHEVFSHATPYVGIVRREV